MRDHQNLLVLRYSTNIEKECIKKHSEILEENGYCWFGKIGNIPSEKIMRSVFNEETGYLLLYKKGAAYLCVLGGYTTDCPVENVPQYYKENGISPTVYFKLLSIEPCAQNVLRNIVVKSTGLFAEDALYHSRIPFMLCEYIDEENRDLLGENECRYRRDDFCTNCNCVNHKGYCERPSSCSKQRR